MKDLLPPPDELDFQIDDRDWQAMVLLLDEFEEELSERRSALLYRVSVWKMAVRILKRAATERMILKEPTRRDYNYHRPALTYLKGAGRILEQELLRHDEIDPKDIGITIEDFSAMVEEMELQEREWYGDMKPEMSQETLAALNLVPRP